ncbi:MAG: YfhO family protein [Oscillospiraceae bacterium]|nr:YfhO family protein [Oscillospiraceae bacterium]
MNENQSAERPLTEESANPPDAEKNPQETVSADNKSKKNKSAPVSPLPPVTMKFSLKHWLYTKRYYLFAFFTPALLLLIAYFCFGIHPFGNESVLVLDLNGQYVYYYEHMRDVLHGEGSPFISWSRNLSGETMGIFAYYLASPFMMIIMLLPRSIITESILIMQLCKVGTSAVTMMFYLKKSRNNNNKTAFLFSVFYALMSYMIVQLMNPMWLDGLIYLPLICRGIERIINEKGRIPYFTIPLALMFMAHFYIGWMLVFFSILYFFYYYFSARPDSRFRIKHFILSGLKFACGGITAALCAAWVLLPLYKSLSLGKLEFSTPDYKWETQFDFIDFFRNLLPNMYDTCRPEGSPAVYCGVLTLILVPLYFMNRRISLRNKIGSGLLLLSIALSMYISNIDLAWHGMQVPNWLPYRYSFTFSFVMIIIAAHAFENIRGITLKEIGSVMFGLIVYVFYIDKQGLENADVITAIWYSVICIALYGLVLYMYRKRRVLKPALFGVFTAFVVLETFASTLHTLFAIDEDVNYSKYDSYNNYITLGRETVQDIKAQDSGIYRIESTHHRTVNDAMALGYYGVSHSSSTLNAKPIQFLRKLGFSYGGHYTKYNGATYVTDALFGIKYIIEKGEVDSEEIPESKSYEELILTNSNEKDTMYVYENPYALPIAFMVDSEAADCTLSSHDYPFENQNKILSSMLGEDEKYFFNRMKIDKTVPENTTATVYGVHARYTVKEEGKNSQVEFFVTPETDDMVYMYLPSSYERKVNLWLNKEFVDYYFEQGRKVITTLGRFNPGEQFSLIATIDNEKNEVLFKDEQFFYLDEDMFREAVDTLKQHPLEITDFAEDHIKGTITAETDGIMYTSITNEPGWTIWVDGVETEPVELYEALIGVPLTAGTHTIEMKFFPDGLKTGLLLTVAGVCIVVIVVLLDYRSKKNPAGKKKK